MLLLLVVENLLQEDQLCHVSQTNRSLYYLSCILPALLWEKRLFQSAYPKIVTDRRRTRFCREPVSLQNLMWYGDDVHTVRHQNLCPFSYRSRRDGAIVLNWRKGRNIIKWNLYFHPRCRRLATGITLRRVWCKVIQTSVLDSNQSGHRAMLRVLVGR